MLSSIEALEESSGQSLAFFFSCAKDLCQCVMVKRDV